MVESMVCNQFAGASPAKLFEQRNRNHRQGDIWLQTLIYRISTKFFVKELELYVSFDLESITHAWHISAHLDARLDAHLDARLVTHLDDHIGADISEY